MSFREAIEATPSLKPHLKNGLQALGNNSNKVKPTDTKKCEGSVDIDKAVQRQYPIDPRWDYAIGYDGRTYFIEIHPADTSEVEAVLNKLQWLKKFLEEEATAFHSEPRDFYWIASNSVHILKTSRESRKLSQVGLNPVKQLLL